VSEAFTGNHLGMWRILGLEEPNEMPGLLSFDEPGVAALELSVPYEQFMKKLLSPSEGYSPTVLGTDDRGTRYSIFNCHITSGSMASGKPAPSSAIKMRSTCAIAGQTIGEVQTESMNKLEFSAILFRSPTLADWWHVPGPDTQRNEDTITEVQHTPTPVDLGTWDGISLRLACQLNVRHSSYPQSQGEPRAIGVDRDIYLRMASASSHPLQDYMRLLEMVCTFASIALQKSIDAPAITAYSSSYTLKLGSSGPVPLEIQVLWPLRGRTMHGRDDRIERLLSVESQADLIVRMLGKWHDNYERLEPNTKPLLNSYQYSDLPQPERFLAAVSALEGLHRIAYPQPSWPADEWRQRIDSVINTSAPKKLQKWARGYLKNSNEPNLLMRLTQFCNDSSSFFISHDGSAFFGPAKAGPTEFVNSVAKLRNKFAHSLPQLASAQEDIRRLNVYTRECEALLLVSLFKYLGWTDEDVTLGGGSDAFEWFFIRNAFRRVKREGPDVAATTEKNPTRGETETTAETLLS